MMFRPYRATLAACLALVCGTAAAHARLVSSAPAAGQLLDAPPTAVRLSFDEAVEARYTRLQLVDAGGHRFDADRAQADKSDPKSVSLTVPVLKSGAWRATWTTVGTDGHKTHGDFSFTVH